MIRFKVGASVRVADSLSLKHGRLGVIRDMQPSAIYRGRNFCRVELFGVNGGSTGMHGFACDQLLQVTSGVTL